MKPFFPPKGSLTENIYKFNNNNESWTLRISPDYKIKMHFGFKALD